MLDEIKKNSFKQSLFREAPNMTSLEKKISFLNRYFIFKKIREVNIEKIQLELGEYEEMTTQKEKEETTYAVLVAKEQEAKIKPKVKKLSKKILLVPATEAIDEETIKQKIEETIKKDDKSEKKKRAKPEEKKKSKKLIIIESDSD
jgi:hypothetical protein